MEGWKKKRVTIKWAAFVPEMRKVKYHYHLPVPTCYTKLTITTHFCHSIVTTCHATLCLRLSWPWNHKRITRRFVMGQYSVDTVGIRSGPVMSKSFLLRPRSDRLRLCPALFFLCLAHCLISSQFDVFGASITRSSSLLCVYMCCTAFRKSLSSSSRKICPSHCNRLALMARTRLNVHVSSVTSCFVCCLWSYSPRGYCLVRLEAICAAAASVFVTLMLVLLPTCRENKRVTIN